MKTLYESILTDNEIKESLLSDIETNIAKGGKLVTSIYDEFINVKQLVSKVKNYDGHKYSHKNKYIAIKCPNLLEYFGYENCQYISFTVFIPGVLFPGQWGLAITLNSDKNVVYRSEPIHLSTEWEVFKGIVNDFIKPAVKDIDTLKNFLSTKLNR